VKEFIGFLWISKFRQFFRRQLLLIKQKIKLKGFNMNNSLKFILSIVFASLLILSGCEVKDSPTSGDGSEGGTVTVSGQVVESSSGDPINNALVKVTDGVNEAGAATSSSGIYSVTLDIDKDKEVKIIV
jgi:hypothetical protein